MSPQAARVQAPPPQAELPSWFWGVLGCLTILGVGFTVMFFAIKSPAGTTAAIPPAVVAPPAPSAPAPASAPRPSGIQVEQLAPPPAALLPTPVRKAPRPVKVARSPAPAPRAAVGDESDEAPAAEAEADEEAPKHKAPARVRAAAAPTEESADAP